MSQYNIGPKIGIEGEKEFRAQITRINSEYRSMDSYLNAVEKSMAKQGATQDLLAQKSNGLRQQITLQERAYKEYAQALEKIKGLEGDHSAEILRYEGALRHTENTLADLRTALGDTEQAMANLASGVSAIEAETAATERRISDYRQEVSRLNDEYDAAKTYTDAVGRSMASTGRSMEGLSNQANGLWRQIDLQQQIFVALQSELDAAAGLYGENSSEVLRLSAAIEDVKTTVSGLERELSKNEQALYDVANGIDDVGESADSAEPKVLSFGDMLKAGIASGAILNGLERAGEMIVDIGQQSIEAAADVKAANAQFQQTFGELEGRATSALKSIADETGIATTRLQGGYTALYAFTKSVGGDQETALNIAQRALSAAADSAAYYDRTMEDATETLQSFLKGNYANDAALGIAATETTRNAKANELYAKSFKELSEAQKVDVLLAMVEAGNAASGALGQAAREADNWTNVTGELSEAWKQFLAQLGGPILTGLTPMIQGITEALNGLTAVSSWQELNRGVESFRAGIAGAGEALETSNTEIAATAGLAGQYLDRLRELEQAGLTTEAAMREYAATVDLLNQLQPQLNLSIDEGTGRLKQNTDEIYNNIQTLKNQAKEQAQQAYYAAIVENLTAVQKDRYAAEMRLYELQARQQDLLEAGAQVVDMYAYTQAAAAGTADQFWASLSDQDKALYEVMLEIQSTEQALAGYDAEILRNEQVLDAAVDAQERMNKGLETGAGAADQQAESIAEIRKAYEAAKTAARDSIDSQIGLFDELADKNEYSAEKILKNWERQKEAFTNYEDNLKKAVEMGLDEALVQQLSDGSQQSMMILDALVNDVGISVDEINEGFRGVSESRDSVSREIALMRDGVVLILDEMSGKARAMGYDTGQGVAQGIRDATPDMEAAMRRLAAKGISAYAYEMDQHSPSRVMRAKGKDSGRGAALGVEDSIPRMEKAMTALAQAGQESYAQQQLDYVAQYPSMMQGVPGYGGGTTNNTRNVAYGGISININTQPGQDAQSIADAVLQELTVRLGQEEASW